MEVKIEVKRDFVLTTLTGPVSLPEIRQAMREGVDAAHESGLPRMVFDWSGVTGILTTGNRIELTEFGVAHTLGKAWKERPKVAVLGTFPMMNGFATAMAVNRGLAMKTFREMNPALDWLGVPNSGRI